MRNSQKVNKTYRGSWTLKFSFTQEKKKNKKKKSTYCDPLKKYFFPPEIEITINAEEFFDLKCVFNLLEMTFKRSSWSNGFLVVFKNVIHWRSPPTQMTLQHNLQKTQSFAWVLLVKLL